MVCHPTKGKQGRLSDDVTASSDTGQRNMVRRNIDILSSDGGIKEDFKADRSLGSETDKPIITGDVPIDIAKTRLSGKRPETSERIWYSLLRNVPDVILNLSRDGTILFMNHGPSGSLIQNADDKTIYDLMPPEYHKKTREAIKKVFESGKALSFETSFVEEDGSLKWYSTRLCPVCDGEEVVSVEQVSTDITASKQKEEELSCFRARMARSEWLASLGTLSATVAHELAQPLTVVRLSLDDALDALEETPLPEDVMEELVEALSQVCNLTAIVERFRNLVRKPTERIVQKVDVRVVAEKVINLLAESAQRAKMVLRLREMAGLPPVFMRERDLEQLFFILIENSIQAADAKRNRQLNISGTVEDRVIKLRFSDDCSGIEPENLVRIFDPFFTTKSPGQGTGLGLYIARELLSRVGGRIWVESDRGNGSTFFVTLPLNRESML